MAIRLHVWGQFACFTRPEMKAERVSYDIMTPAAARGVLEAIHWKPSIFWQIDKIHVLEPIRFQTIRRNEVASKIPERTARIAMNKNTLTGLGLAIDKERQQRATVALANVAYVIEAHFVLTERAGVDETSGKHLEMFKRRAASGQCFHRPYLGCREFAADFELVEAALPLSNLPEAERTKDFGWMHYDIEHQLQRPIFFKAEMRDGIIDVAAARAAGLVR